MKQRRTWVRIVVSALSATLTAAVLVPGVAQAASLSLNPTHGQNTASFTAAYSDAGRVGCPYPKGTEVDFFWDSSNTPLGSSQLNGKCHAGLTAVPPSGMDSVGPHSVLAGICYPSGDCAITDLATATYVIDPPATPSPAPTATPKPTSTPAPKPTAVPTATPAPPGAPPAGPTASPTASPSATASATAIPTSTSGPSPTPTQIVSPAGATPTPAPTLAATEGGDSGGASGSGVGWGPSAFVASIKDIGDISLDFAVLSTNFLLTLLLLLIFGTTSALFNNTLDANRLEIDTRLAGLRHRLARIGQPIAGGLGAIVGSVGPGRRTPPLRVATILLLTGLVYGFLSPDFGLNGQSLILFLSLALGLGIVTYVNEGGAALFASRRLHVPAGVRVHLAALSVAVVCVLASRLIDFKPGIVYGFIASTAFLVPAALDRRQEGKVALYPALVLLAVSLVAWLLMGVVRGMETGADGPLLPFTEALLAVVFVGGLEGLFFNMVPLTFMDGKAVSDWSKVVWAVTFGVATFLFWQLLINPDAGYLDALRETKVVVAVTLVVFYVVITLGTWSYFRWRARSRVEPA